MYLKNCLAWIVVWDWWFNKPWWWSWYAFSFKLTQCNMLNIVYTVDQAEVLIVRRQLNLQIPYVFRFITNAYDWLCWSNLISSDYVFKLPQIGDSGVGKSWLLLRFACLLFADWRLRGWKVMSSSEVCWWQLNLWTMPCSHLCRFEEKLPTYSGLCSC